MITPELARKALGSVQRDPQHHLNLGIRCQFFCSLDREPDGKQKRTCLATLTVKKVLPMWESMFPNDQAPHRALEIAKQTALSNSAPAQAEEELGQLWTHCDDLAWRYVDNQNVIAVGYAAAQAIREAISQSHFGRDGLSPESADIDHDPYDSDSALLASIAFAGGAPWEAHSDRDQRLVFWTWWITASVNA